MSREIRRASLEDIGIIRAIAGVAFRETYKQILTPEQIDYMMDWMYSEESLRRQMMQEETVFHILSDEGVDAGYVSFGRHLSPPADLAGWTVFELHKIYLLPSHQGTGCGSFLLQSAEQQMVLMARNEGAKVSGDLVSREAEASEDPAEQSAAAPSRICYELNVNRHNPALGFYKHNGLQINRQGDFSIGLGYFMNDYIMRKIL